MSHSTPGSAKCGILWYTVPMMTRFTNEAGDYITLGQLIFRTAVYACGTVLAVASAYWTTVFVFCL